jgi:FAD/FMN-containing dehydrogenase
MKPNYKQDLDQFRSAIKGKLVLPEDSNYNEVRKIWNAMIDRRPAIFVQCSGAGDVQQAIAFGRKHGLQLSIRGAGHNIAGNALSDGGLVIDLSTLKKVSIDSEKKRAIVDPGATLHDFDEAAQKFGLATPVGINSTTGIAGLTVGGGFGWLTRKYGLTVDNLLSAEVVTADGEKRTVNNKENPDLFWAIRGGGGNFGVVTKFEFQLHPVGPEILAGLMVFPFQQAKQVLQKYSKFTESAPEELNIWTVVRKAPPLPFLPPAIHGKEVVVLAIFYAGRIADGEKLIAPIRSFGDLVGEHVGPVPYVQWQQAFDPLLTAGVRNYWKSHYFMELSDPAVDAIISYASRLPTPHTEIFVGLLSGAANRVPSDAMAYSHRQVKYVMNVHGRWEDPSEDQKGVSWSREFFNATAPYAHGGVYVNFMTDDETSRVPAAFGSNYERLAQIKKKYDPENVFHLNQNIKPA